jgi:hypothetical protein
MTLILNPETQNLEGTVNGVAVVGYEQNGGWYEVWRAGDEDRADGVSLGLVQVADLAAAEQEIAGWLAK